MEWYYSVADQQNGPVSEEDICSLIAQHRIHGDTLVWNETIPEWQKLSMPIGLTPTCAISSGSSLVFFLKRYVIVSKRVPLIKTARIGTVFRRGAAL